MAQKQARDEQPFSLQLSPSRIGGQLPIVIPIPDGVELKIRDLTIKITSPPPVMGQKPMINITINF